jgi:peptidylprolyl isomerase
MTDQRAPGESAISGELSKGGPAQPVQRRGPAIVGAAIGVVVVAVMIGILLGSGSGSDKSTAASPMSAPAPAAAAPAAPASQTPPSQEAAAGQPTTAVTGALAQKPVVTAGTGKLTKLVVTPLIKGTGPAVKKGQTVTVNYVLVGYKDGKEIESSWASGGPVPLQVGVGQLIKGWDMGLPGQHVGSRVRLDVPAGLAYGDAKGDLRFVVDILSAQ